MEFSYSSFFFTIQNRSFILFNSDFGEILRIYENLIKETRECGWRVGEVLRLYEELMKVTVLKQERD